MKLFHGSNIEIYVPDLSRSKPYKDFGQGFYLSDNYLQAEEMAMHKVDQLRTGSNTKPVHHHDIVIGPIADDGVTFQLRRFSTGIIPMEKLIEELKFHKGKTIQYFFGTEKALNYLKKL